MNTYDESSMVQKLESIFNNAKTELERYQQLNKLLLDKKQFVSANSLLCKTAESIPKKKALICWGRSITYGELYKRASFISHLLVKNGIKPKDRVFVLFENSIEFYMAYYGAWQTGAVVSPINTFLHEKEIQHILDEAKPKALIVSSHLSKSFEGKVPFILTEKDFIRKKIPKTKSSFKPYRVAPDEMTVLLYTSGTTGKPKGVMLSSKNILTNVIQAVSRLQFVGSERVFGVLPLFHSFAQNTCVWTSMFVGATVIVVPKIERRFILEGLGHKPTFFLGVPALYGVLCLLKTAPIDSVKYFICGGDALPDKIRAAFALVYRRKLVNGYGLTEASPVVTSSLEDTIKHADIVGHPVLGIECSIRDEKEKELPQGQDGVLWIKGDNVMLGYYKSPSLTKKVLKKGWLNTGDCAYIDREGRIVITGREKDLIIHKGFNIYPQEIEHVLLSHSHVMLAGVVGRQDAAGEVPIAFVQLKTEHENIESELDTLCKNSLASYKVPKEIHVIKKMPLTGMGKINKKILREENHE